MSKQEETVKYLSEFLVCQNDECYQPTSIYHKSYFKMYHFDLINNKKVTHKSIPFDQSGQYFNFYNISKLENIITKKVTESLRGFPTNIENVVQTAIYGSQLFNQLFSGSQGIGQYLYLRNLQKGIEMGFAYGFSQAFCTSLLMGQDKKISKCFKELSKDSPEWENLNVQFNLASGINSINLQNFIEKEATYFIQYCGKLEVEKKPFNISDYISLRNTSSQYQNDPYYFSPQFTGFLTSKYERNPENEELFTLMEYYLSFWEYFHVTVEGKNVSRYLEQELSFYKQYESIMAQYKLNESFLGYRMWRINHKVSTVLPSLRNPFFLESFIYSFIEQLIYKKTYYPEQKCNYDFKQFSRYIKDYVKFTRDKNEGFNFARYREYFDFRRKSLKLQESLQKNKDIIYSRKFFLEYVHDEFVDNNKIAVKKYKKYHEAKKQDEDQKIKSFKYQSEALKIALEQEEKQSFYEIIFINFLTYLHENNLQPKKEVYSEYKARVLENMDQTYLQEEQAKYRQALAESKEEENAESKEEIKQKKEEIVKEEINEVQEEIAGIIGDQERSVESSEYSQEVQAICACCKGQPYDCQEKECIVMGCCTACMLD